jgi:hypothetical protein
MLFDWDPAKADANFGDHGVSFEEAMEAFRDPNAVDEYDATHSDDEPRYALTGLSSRRLLFVVYTEKPGVIWLISARKAEGSKRKRYEEENQ